MNKEKSTQSDRCHVDWINLNVHELMKYTYILFVENRELEGFDTFSILHIISQCERKHFLRTRESEMLYQNA